MKPYFQDDADAAAREGVMSPSTNPPQDASKRPGWWTCKVCDARERGGQSAFYAHWLATHWVEVKA